MFFSFMSAVLFIIFLYQSVYLYGFHLQIHIILHPAGFFKHSLLFKVNFFKTNIPDRRFCAYNKPFLSVFGRIYKKLIHRGESS